MTFWMQNLNSADPLKMQTALLCLNIDRLLLGFAKANDSYPECHEFLT